MKKLLLILSFIAVAVIGFFSWSINKEKQKSKQLRESALPAYGDPLVSDQSSQNSDVLSALTKPASSRPSSEELKSYEQYKSSKNLLTGDIKKGDGAKAEAGKAVAVAYTGYLTNGQIFDKTKDKALTFVVGKHTVIAGFEQGVFGMQVGGKRRLIVPPSLGYGNQAMGQIPPNSVLVFEVELLAVQ